MNLEKYICDVPDYPKPGIIFKDITPLLGDAQAFHFAIDELAAKFAEQKLGAGLAIVRKPGKLPRQIIREDYTLEYASNTLEMHHDAIKLGQNVLIIDDVLATGGTMEATCKMVQKLGGQIVGIGFLTELGFLKGKEKLKDLRIESLIHYS
jgi:adenine phosphoribosyltransferase